MPGVSNQILIVDDSCFNILALQGIFSIHFGMETDTASDGEQALKKVKEKFQLTGGRETYKLILMDFSMYVYRDLLFAWKSKVGEQQMCENIFQIILASFVSSGTLTSKVRQ